MFGAVRKMDVLCDLESFKNGAGLSTKSMRHKVKKGKLWQHKIEVWTVRKLGEAAKLAKEAEESGAWTKGIMPLTIIFEAWNMQLVMTALSEAKSRGEDVERAWVDLAGAAVDFAAMATTVQEQRLKAHHHALERAANMKLQEGPALQSAKKLAFRANLAAGAFSAGLSFIDMYNNAREGDDAAIAHGVMGVGFLVSTAGLLAGAYGAASIAALAGPLGWVGAVIILAGAALLALVFPDDTPLEEWLANGPFSKDERFGGRFSVWGYKPHSAYQALTGAIYSPMASLRHRFIAEGYKSRLEQGTEKTSEWGVELNVYIPTYFDNRSRLYIEATRHGKTLYEHFEYLETEEGGSGPRTLRIPINVPDNVKARVSLDLYGDKRLVLPLGGKYWDSDKPIELQIGRPRDLDMD